MRKKCKYATYCNSIKKDLNFEFAFFTVNYLVYTGKNIITKLIFLSVYFKIVGVEHLSEPRDQVTCGQCGDRFSLADLTSFLQHKMAASCTRSEVNRASGLSSPRVSGTDEAVEASSWQPREEKIQAELLTEIEGILYRCKNILEMWWPIGSPPDLWGRGPGFASGISHNDPDVLQDHWVIMKKISGKRGKPTPEAKTR